MLIDSHCHLDFEDFAEDIDGVLARAGDADVGAMQTICTRLTQFDDVLAMAQRHHNIWCSVGVHPHNVGDEPAFDAAHLVRIAAHPKVIGIGETGLDFYYDHSPRDRQETAFRAHIHAARETGLPLIVHTRDADEATNRVLRDEAADGPFPGVIHCFSADRSVAETALELGFSISFSGIVTFKNAHEVRAVAKDVPLDRLLVETDAPYLAPTPKRGKRNEPAFVRHTAAFLADFLDIPFDALAKRTTDNFFDLFSKADRQAIQKQ